MMELHDTFRPGWGQEAIMQGLLRLLRARFARYAARRRANTAKPADIAAPGTPGEPNVTILSYDSFR
jgi:hypothetical protein